jgi:hypothetical protein
MLLLLGILTQFRALAPEAPGTNTVVNKHDLFYRSAGTSLPPGHRYAISNTK